LYAAHALIAALLLASPILPILYTAGGRFDIDARQLLECVMCSRPPTASLV